MRNALGASRGRVVRQALVESFVLAAAGAAVGSVLAVAILHWGLPYVPGDVPRLVLATCYPFDALTTGGPLRYLVFAEADPIAQAAARP